MITKTTDMLNFPQSVMQCKCPLGQGLEMKILLVALIQNHHWSLYLLVQSKLVHLSELNK